MDIKEYDKLKEIVSKQLSRYHIDKGDYDDYVHECYIYIVNRKGKFDINDIYIYGDVRNAILNYFKYNKRFIMGDIIPNLHGDLDNAEYRELIDLVESYDYGYLVVYRYIYGYSVKELSDMFNLKESKIYYEINKITESLNWVYR